MGAESSQQPLRQEACRHTRVSQPRVSHTRVSQRAAECTGLKGRHRARHTRHKSRALAYTIA